MMASFDWLRINGSAISPVIIFISAIIAVIAVWTQRDLSRKRATLDLFIKTETDGRTAEMWQSFVVGVETFEQSQDKANFKSSHPKEYDDIRSYLNIFELGACGILVNILDEKMCRNYFGLPMIESFDKVSLLIDNIQKEPYSRDYYTEFVKLSRRWRKKYPARTLR